LLSSCLGLYNIPIIVLLIVLNVCHSVGYIVHSVGYIGHSVGYIGHSVGYIGHYVGYIGHSVGYIGHWSVLLNSLESVRNQL